MYFIFPHFIQLLGNLANCLWDKLATCPTTRYFTFPPIPWGGDPLVSWFAIMRVLGLSLSLLVTEWVKRSLDTSDNIKVARLLSGVYGIISLGLLIFAWSKDFYLAIGATLLEDIMRSLTGPLIDTWVNKYIESKVRATMLSMTSQLDAFGQIFGGPLVGFIGNLHSIKAALTTSAFLVLPSVPLYRKTIHQSRQEINSVKT